MIRVSARESCHECPACESLHVLNTVAVCGLILSTYGPLPWFFRMVIAVLTGRALAASAVHAQGGARRPARATVLYIAVVWVATFSPIAPPGNPDIVRSGVAAAALVLILGALPSRPMLMLSAALLVTGIVADGAAPHAGVLGDLEYALGATWPRDLGDVATTAGFFVLGGAWAKRRALELAVSGLVGAPAVAQHRRDLPH